MDVQEHGEIHQNFTYFYTTDEIRDKELSDESSKVSFWSFLDPKRIHFEEYLQKFVYTFSIQIKFYAFLKKNKELILAWKFKLLLLLMQRKNILARKFKFYVLQEKKSIFSILQSRNYSWAFFSFSKVTYSIVANNVWKLPKLSHFKQNCWFLARKIQITFFLKNEERYNNETFWLIFKHCALPSFFASRKNQ